MNSAMGWTAVACVGLLAGCAAQQPTETATTKQPAASGPSLKTPSNGPTWELSARKSQGSIVTDAELAMMKQFVLFALEPTEQSAGQVPFADDGVRLGLGAELVQSLGPSELPDPRAWVIRMELFRGYTGPFSPLSSIQRHVQGTDWGTPMRQSGDLQVSVGAHPHCASPPVPAPPGLESLQRVSVQPADTSITTCLAWFSVDLFVDAAGDIEAVTLDLYEP